MAESGPWMVVAASSSLRLYKDGLLVRLLDTYGDDPLHTRLAAVAFSPDRKFLAALVSDNSSGRPAARLRIYDLIDGVRQVDKLAHEGGLADQYSGVALAWSPDGTLLATGAGDGRVVLMNTAKDGPDGTLGYEPVSTLDTLATGTLKLAFRADGQQITLITRLGSGFSANHETAQIQVWDVADPAAPHQVMDRGASLYWPNAHLATLSEDGRFAAYLTQEGSVQFQDMHTNLVVGQFPVESGTVIEGIAVSLMGDKLAFIQRTLNPSDDSVVLRVLNWWYQFEDWHYGDLYQPRALSGRGAYQLHFGLNQDRLDYIPLDTGNLTRWHFDTGQLTTMNF
jgi:WD40 repeat protein